MMRRLLGLGRLAVAALSVLAAGGSAARAQTCTAGYPGSCVVSGNASITVDKVMSFQLSTPGTTAPTPTYADYVQGYNETAGPTITIRANTPWTISVSAATALWTAASLGGATPRPDKPCTDLLWTRTAGSGFLPLSTTAATITAGTATANTTIPLFYRVLYALDLDAPGTYSLDVVVTVVTP